ncbi:MAG: tRNA (adenosine(37)-N6)-threonylcarbamoyltransferase complex transferase subunit TsaD, partial [Malacoplasma sp.]|nr:tRNA (adenosine(37)-N6)-threonylcarbamoyltransferase complex transferase subunit TsaD [Malacoplasma sp.]
MNQKKKNCNILAIETSCDDTSLAILKNGKVVANVTRTKFADHKNYGGIIPEYASRNHAKYLNTLFNDALKSAHLKAKDIDCIAYTSHPGLVGCLHTGKVFAHTLSYLLDKPLIKVDHMIGHAFSFCID